LKAVNAGIGQAIVEDPTKRGLRILDEDGGVSEIRFADTPMNRMITALLERFGATDEYASAASRIWALFGAIRQGELKEWIRPGETAEITEIHPAVMDAAATVILTPDGKFPTEEFLAKVKELDQANYQDDDEPRPDTK
jgi:hypothetical protein